MKEITKKEVFSYLDDLRETGITNMFGATPFIVNAFPKLSKEEAREYLKLWMKEFKG